MNTPSPNRKPRQINQRATPEVYDLLDDLARETGFSKTMITELALKRWAHEFRSGTLVLTPAELRPSTDKK